MKRLYVKSILVLLLFFSPVVIKLCACLFLDPERKRERQRQVSERDRETEKQKKNGKIEENI